MCTYICIDDERIYGIASAWFPFALESDFLIKALEMVANAKQQGPLLSCLFLETLR